MTIVEETKDLLENRDTGGHGFGLTDLGKTVSRPIFYGQIESQTIGTSDDYTLSADPLDNIQPLEIRHTSVQRKKGFNKRVGKLLQTARTQQV